MSVETAGRGETRMQPSELRGYWSRLSSRFLDKDPDGLAVICCAGMPPWFNGFLDRYQRMAFARLTRNVDFRGARVLDIGTGIGRWARWFVERGADRVVGVDLEQRRLGLAAARSCGRSIHYHQMSVDSLAFASETFDVVNSVTVLQHVDRDTKARAIAEIARVLRPGGNVILFELTDMHDDAPHVFPERRAAWIDMCRAEGLHLVRTGGDQYTPLVRLAKAVVGRLAGRSARPWIDQFKSGGLRRGAFHPSMLLLRVLLLFSYPVEEICQRVLPPRMAKIGGFHFRKE